MCVCVLGIVMTGIPTLDELDWIYIHIYLEAFWFLSTKKGYQVFFVCLKNPRNKDRAKKGPKRKKDARSPLSIQI